jgi:hypothetical protein
MGFSATDYLVGSAQVSFLPVATVLIVALMAVVFHQAVATLLRRRTTRWAKSAVWMSACLGASLLCFAAFGLGNRSGFRTGYSALGPPIALSFGALLVAFSVHLAGKHLSLAKETRRALDGTWTAMLSILVAVQLVGLFWATATFADFRGRVAAQAFEVSLPLEPRAAVYAKQRLYITGPGIQLAELAGSNAAYSYRYSGLRLLVHTNNRWFLLPAGWKHTNGATVIILPDTSTDIRVDLAP